MFPYGALLFTFGLKTNAPIFYPSDHFSEKLITFHRISFQEIFAGSYSDHLLIWLKKTGTHMEQIRRIPKSCVCVLICSMTNIEWFLKVTNSNSPVFHYKALCVSYQVTGLYCHRSSFSSIIFNGPTCIREPQKTFSDT